MIYEQNVTLVICLTETSPISYGYLTQYWPDQQNSSDVNEACRREKVVLNYTEGKKVE